MFGIFGKIKREVCGRTVYMEIFGDNRVYYRVTAGRVFFDGREIVTYGIETENTVTGEREAIPDFSRDIEDAVDFAEMLIANRTMPHCLYTKALDYLRISI